jgi:hypothetical protein
MHRGLPWQPLIPSRLGRYIHEQSHVQAHQVDRQSSIVGSCHPLLAHRGPFVSGPLCKLCRHCYDQDIECITRIVKRMQPGL